MYIDFQNIAEIILAILILVGGFYLVCYLLYLLVEYWDAILNCIIVLTLCAIVFLTVT